MGVQVGVRKELAELPEDANCAGQRESDQVSAKSCGSAKYTRERLLSFKHKVGNRCSPAEVHGEVERLTKRRPRDDSVQDQHPDGRPTGS